MAPSPDLIHRLFDVVRTAVSTFLLIVLFYILQHIFDMDFVCSCRYGVHQNGILYLFLPPLILTCVVNIIEPFHQRKTFSSRHWFSCKGCSSCWCSYLSKFVLKYFSLSAVWIATVLFDGDWYFCLMTNLNKSETGIPCRGNLTYAEHRIEDAYKTQSLDYGLIVSCAFLCLWSIVEIRGAYCKSRHQWCPPYYTVVYEELLAEQVSRHLNNQLKQIATKKAKAICQPYLQVIKNHERSVKNGTDDDNSTEVSKAWKQISDSGFYLRQAQLKTGGTHKDPGENMEACQRSEDCNAQEGNK